MKLKILSDQSLEILDVTPGDLMTLQTALASAIHLNEAYLKLPDQQLYTLCEQMAKQRNQNYPIYSQQTVNAARNEFAQLVGLLRDAHTVLTTNPNDAQDKDMEGS